MKFPSTLLPQTNDPKETQKGVLDLLDKLNSLALPVVNTAAWFARFNPTLLAGQIGYETDTLYFKIGDGKTAYKSLLYQFKQVLYSGDVVYIPAFTGFGTVTVQNFVWTRVGNRIKVMGQFTSGTVTGTEARISLPGSLVSDAALIASITPCGIFTRGAAAAVSVYCLIEPGKGYITFGQQAAGQAALTKVLANNLIGSVEASALQFELPVQFWNI